MEALLKQEFPTAQVLLTRGHSGVYDIRKEGSLIFSKFEAGRFPEDDEILAALKPDEI